jgi:hypothetical protein
MGEPAATSKLVTYGAISLFATALTVTIGYCWWNSALTTPVMDGFENSQRVENAKARVAAAEQRMKNATVNEGFAGPAVGAGVPNCMNTSKDCAALYDMLSPRSIKTDDGPGDLREIQLILSKISCLKRDLLGNSKVVQATRYQPFSTSHDLEPVAETAARCFSKTIPQRDLSLSLDKWGSRGTFLIKRLCTAMNLSDAEEKEALRLFGSAMADLSDIALGECCNTGNAVIGGQQAIRMVSGFTPPATQALREYKGYY